MLPSLKQKAFNSSLWIIFGNIAALTLRLGSNLLLTRLLVPDMFGLMAVVMVILNGFALLIDIGLMQNIVQSKRGEEARFLNTAWTIQILRGVIVFILIILLSLLLEKLVGMGFFSSTSVYADPQLPDILIVISLTALINGFDSIHIHVIQRQLMQSKLIRLDLTSQVLGTLFTIAWAWFHRDVWALVFGALVASMIRMVLSHSLIKTAKPRLDWEAKSVHEIIDFGKWVFLATGLFFLITQGDRIVLGALVGPDILGIYAIAFLIVSAFKDLIARLVTSVFLPVLSEIVRDRPSEIEKIFYQLRFRIDLLVIPSAGLLLALSQDIIMLLYDPRYHDAGWMLQMLSLSLITSSFMIADQLFFSLGKPQYVSLANGIMVVVLFISIPVSFYYSGLEAAILSVALAPLSKNIVSMILMKKHFFLNIYREVMLLPLVFVGYFIGEKISLFLF